MSAWLTPEYLALSAHLLHHNISLPPYITPQSWSLFKCRIHLKGPMHIATCGPHKPTSINHTCIHSNHYLWPASKEGPQPIILIKHISIWFWMLIPQVYVDIHEMWVLIELALHFFQRAHSFNIYRQKLVKLWFDCTQLISKYSTYLPNEPSNSIKACKTSRRSSMSCNQWKGKVGDNVPPHRDMSFPPSWGTPIGWGELPPLLYGVNWDFLLCIYVKVENIILLHLLMMLNSLLNSPCWSGAKLKKSNRTMKDPPFFNLMCSFSIKVLHIWAMSCHGGIIRHVFLQL